jgi:beta-lactamase class D
MQHKTNEIIKEQNRQRAIFKKVTHSNSFAHSKVNAVIVDQKARLKTAQERERAQAKNDAAAARKEFLTALQEEVPFTTNSLLDLHYKPYDFLGWSPSQKLSRWMRVGVDPVLNLKYVEKKNE